VGDPLDCLPTAAELALLQDISGRARRIAAICTVAFVLAEAEMTGFSSSTEPSGHRPA